MSRKCVSLNGEYSLRCSAPCTGEIKVTRHEDNCIDHILNCPDCQNVLRVRINDYCYKCVACGAYKEKIYSWRKESRIGENGHIASGFGLCVSCYEKLIKKPLTYIRKDSKQEINKAMRDFKKRIKYGGLR